MRECLLLLALALAGPALAADDACYRDPKLALAQGKQSRLEPAQAAAVLKEAGVTGKDGLLDAARLHRWLAENFQSSAAGGKFVGKTTAQGLLQSRELTGCHDWALLLAALLRAAGTPARLADTAGARWLEEARSGQAINGYRGHVFVEAFISGRWVLLDSVSPRYLPDYDPASPLISMEVGGEAAHCVMFKGADPAAYGLDSDPPLGKRMERFAKSSGCGKAGPPQARVLDLPDAGRPLPYLSDDILAGPCALDRSRRGVVLQFPKAGLDVNAERSDGAYHAHLYSYGRVFAEPIKTVSFATLPGLRLYLKGLDRQER